ncbi:Zinc finger MYM-type protein 1, partial [Camponotus floridanus]
DCMDVNKSHEITDNNESRNSENDCIDVDISHEITDNYESHNSEIQNKEVFPIISNDPAKWILNDFTIEYLSTHNIQQNINVDFDFGNSKRYYGNTSRTLTKNVFERRLLNGEIMPRKYLIYSESKGAVFCAPCRLFGGTSSLATNGYDDWKNVFVRIREHENSTEHKTCELKMIKRSNISERIDADLEFQLQGEINYWTNVLKRVVSVVKKLSSRGLAFRGRDEKFGSLHNGNYMMALELIAEFDSFLANHIKNYGNAGRGIVSYLSSQTCNEFVKLMATEVSAQIITEVKKAKYFSISVDSTPDISHIDQLSFILRYVNDNDGMPVERFLCFYLLIPNTGHKSEQLANAVFSTLVNYDLDIANCRGQSYDNASNMSGRYNGLQARIKNKNQYALYVPCSAHSLNLIGVCAAESCHEACNFFSILQHLYTFFSASTHRWEILLSTLKPDNIVIKRMSDTRWSSRAEACRSLIENWDSIIKALNTINLNTAEKPATRNEAAGLLKQMSRFETIFMAVFWNSIMERFQITSKKLQAVDIDIQTVVELYSSLTGYIKSLRNLFDMFEEKAKKKSEVEDYEFDTRRKRKRKLPFDEISEIETEICGKEQFRRDTFFVIIDRISSELERRGNAYKDIFERFEWLSKITSISTADLIDNAKKLQQYYPLDLEESFVDECLHFRAYLESTNILENERHSLLSYSKLLRTRNIHSIYPNIDIACRIFVCTPVTNCSSERSFSALKRIKNCLRANLGDNQLNNFSILTIESDLTISTDFNKLISDFAAKKYRKKQI